MSLISVAAREASRLTASSHSVLSTFRGKAITIASIFHGFGLFMFVFTFSMALGIAFGLGCSLMLKHSRLSTYPPLESCLVTLVAYTSYFFSNGVNLSGIVSLLFCGICLKHYAYHNMSRRTQRATRYIFQTLANLSENFIFIYLGLSLFTQDQLVYKPLFILVTVAAVILSRYSAVFPIAAVVNAVKRARLSRRARRAGPNQLREGSKSEEELPKEYQVMLFWAGLRGAVGFALSANIEGRNASALQTTVLVTVVLTVIVFGGTTAQMLDILGIRTGVEDDEGDSTDEEEEAEIAALRLKNMRRRRKNGSGHRQMPSTSETSALYRDEEDHQVAPAAYPHNGKDGNWKNPEIYSGNVDDDQRSSTSSSTEVLPPQIPLGGSGPYSNDIPDSPARVSQDFAASFENDHGVRHFLDRAGLILRDGRWFSTLDQRYLTPLFTNSVASRKHEERKAMRRSEAALVTAESNGGSPNLTGRRSTSYNASHQQYDPSQIADFHEEDADEREDDDDTALVRSLDGMRSSQAAVGGRGVIRRPSSRTASDEESLQSSTPASANNSSRFTGAFAPSTPNPDNRSAPRPGSADLKQRKSDDFGPL